MAEVLVAVLGGLVVSWLALIAWLWVRKPDAASAREGLRLLPDVARLLRRLATDRSLGWTIRVRPWLLLAYLALPLDLVPDFLPVIGYADDIVVVAVGLRWIVRRAGASAVRGHWPGTLEGLEAMWALARLPGRP